MLHSSGIYAPEYWRLFFAVTYLPMGCCFVEIDRNFSKESAPIFVGNAHRLFIFVTIEDLSYFFVEYNICLHPPGVGS